MSLPPSQTASVQLGDPTEKVNMKKERNLSFSSETLVELSTKIYQTVVC